MAKYFDPTSSFEKLVASLRADLPTERLSRLLDPVSKLSFADPTSKLLDSLNKLSFASELNRQTGKFAFAESMSGGVKPLLADELRRVLDTSSVSEGIRGGLDTSSVTKEMRRLLGISYWPVKSSLAEEVRRTLGPSAWLEKSPKLADEVRKAFGSSLSSVGRMFAIVGLAGEFRRDLVDAAVAAAEFVDRQPDEETLNEVRAKSIVVDAVSDVHAFVQQSADAAPADIAKQAEELRREILAKFLRPADGSDDLAQASYDLAQESYDVAQKSHDLAQASHDLAQASHDLAQASHDLAQASHAIGLKNYYVTVIGILIAFMFSVIALYLDIRDKDEKAPQAQAQAQVQAQVQVGSNRKGESSTDAALLHDKRSPLRVEIEKIESELEKLSAATATAMQGERLYYLVERTTVLRARKSSKSDRLGNLFQKQLVVKVKGEGKWVHIAYFDCHRNEMRWGWVLKKYLSPVSP